MSFIRELKRRNVFKVGITYLVASWLLLQVADVYDKEVERSIQRLLAMLAPMVTILLGFLIAFIIGSILAAILGTYDIAL